MHPYITKWLSVIDGMNNENTYKLAWGRALVELCHVLEPQDKLLVIHYDQISEYFLKYYWNQTYFFKLKQGPAGPKPKIQQITEEMIELYQITTGSTLPVWFEEAKKVFITNPIIYQRYIRKISKTFTENVSHRFLRLSGDDIPLYVLDQKAMTVTFTHDQALIIKDHAFVLSQLLNYRWAQLLEKFNQSPRIAMKVKGISDEQIRRNSLTKFKNALLKQFPDGIVRDFYTDEILDPNDISIDHVIPWSFMYSDDIWNLVITSKRRNSSKSNKPITNDYITKLKHRNDTLIEVLDENFSHQMKESRELNLLDRYYFEFRI